MQASNHEYGCTLTCKSDKCNRSLDIMKIELGMSNCTLRDRDLDPEKRKCSATLLQISALVLIWACL